MLAGPLDVSVVVPVWNPGPNLERCVASLLSQTLPPHRRELIFVDDGSTDGTATRLDELATAHAVDNLRVLHIPNSGWPGRPRNVGLDAARGRYVHFVDNDDELPPYALAELLAAADASEADVVFGKTVSDFRGLNHRVYRRNLSGVTLAQVPELVATLTPHKMFRRDFLHHHCIRFPEGPAPLEDQFVVLPAYLHARSITVLGDRPYYYYLRRLGTGRNAGDQQIDIKAHFGAVDQILDIIDDTVTENQLRSVLLRRFYRINLLNMLIGRAQLQADDEHRQQMIDAVAGIVRARFDPGVTGSVPAADRIVGQLLLARDAEGLRSYAEARSRVWVVPPVCPVSTRVGGLTVEVDTYLARAGSEPLVCERHGDAWALPEYLSPGTPIEHRLLDPHRDEHDIELSLVSRASSAAYGIGGNLSLTITDDGWVRVTGSALIDPAAALSGHPVTDGLWAVRLRVRFAGWDLLTPVRVATPPAPLFTASGNIVVASATGTAGDLLLDVGQWHTTVAAAVAETADLHVVDRRTMALEIAAVAAPGTPVEVTIVLEPLDADSSTLEVTGRLHPHGATALAELQLPALATGHWRAWVRVDSPAGEAVALPWNVVAGLRRLTVTARVPQPA